MVLLNNIQTDMDSDRQTEWVFRSHTQQMICRERKIRGSYKMLDFCAPVLYKEKTILHLIYYKQKRKKQRKKRNNRWCETLGGVTVLKWLKIIFSWYYMNTSECWSVRGWQRATLCLVVGSFNTPPYPSQHWPTLFVEKKAIRGSAQD